MGSALWYIIERAINRLTVANEMLSLQGSIQPDPFSPKHIAHPNKTALSPAFRQDEASEVDARDDGGKEEQEEDESDEDGFRHLARLTDEAQATQKAKRAKEEAERLEKTKKRKRRESCGDVGESPRHGKQAERKRKKEMAS